MPRSRRPSGDRPPLRTIRGESNCSTAPASSGTVDTSPQANWLALTARTKAGRYVSPIPTITLVAVPSAVEARYLAQRSTPSCFLQANLTKARRYSLLPSGRRTGGEGCAKTGKSTMPVPTWGDGLPDSAADSKPYSGSARPTTRKRVCPSERSEVPVPFFGHQRGARPLFSATHRPPPSSSLILYPWFANIFVVDKSEANEYIRSNTAWP